MNHKHRKTLHSVFAHPASANISSRSIEAAIKELDGTIEQRHGGRWGVRLNGHFAEFHHDRHSLHPNQVRQMGKFLTEAGIDPDRDYPL